MLMASSIDAYCRLELSLEMKSFMLEPAGAERCCIKRYFPPFFGTYTPTPEQRRFGSGGCEKGPIVSILLCTLWLVLGQ